MESDNDSFYEEESENEQEVAGSKNINVNVNLEESPEWPPPGPPSPVLPQPIPLVELPPVWELPDNGTNVLNFYTRTDNTELKNWVEVTRERINEEGYFVEELMISQNLAAFLQQYYGHQWELKFLRPSAEVIFEQLFAYIKGYAKLTSLNRRLLREQFESWPMGEKTKQLRLLAESGGFLEIEYVARLCRLSGAFYPSAAFYMFCRVVYCKTFFFGILELHNK